MRKMLNIAGLAVLLIGCGGTETKQIESSDTKTETQSNQVAATVGSESVLLSEVDQVSAVAQKRAKMAYDQQINQIRRDALEAIIEGKLVDLEVSARKLENRQALIKLEVVDKTKGPTAKEIAEFYAENKAEIGDTPIELIKDRIEKYLAVQARESRAESFSDELRAKYPVKELLPKFRLDVGTHGPSKGPKEAKVTIVEYADFECPFCSQTAQTVLAVQKKYPNDVRVVFRHFPLSFHENAMPAAIATRCAQYQDKFWLMHDQMFARSESLNEEEINKAATEIGLDMGLFKKCMSNPTEAAAVQAEMDEGGAFGVEGTPAFFVNGIPLGGAQPFEAFDELVKSELAE